MKIKKAFHAMKTKEKISLFLVIVPLLLVSATIQEGNPRYLFQAGTPIAIGNFLYPDKGCNWLGIVGQVFDGYEPVENIIVKLEGEFDGEPILIYAITGGTPGLGKGGYELYLSSSLVASDNTLNIQLINMIGIPVSPEYSISTYADCSSNTILVNFLNYDRENDIFLPQIYKR
jgi:hypothetical protein